MNGFILKKKSNAPGFSKKKTKAWFNWLNAFDACNFLKNKKKLQSRVCCEFVDGNR